jgi:putative endonuclease
MGLAALTLALERRATTHLRALADRRHARRDIRAGKNPKPAHLLTGERGEDAAFFHLRALGYTIVARRWRAERLRGDLDLVAWDGDTLVIFEIKTRTARDLAPAEAEVDPYKQQILRRMAAAYLRQFPEPHRASVPVRFDVLSVYLLPGEAAFEHLREAAFEHFRDAIPLTAPVPRHQR